MAPHEPCVTKRLTRSEATYIFESEWVRHTRQLGHLRLGARHPHSVETAKGWATQITSPGLDGVTLHAERNILLDAMGGRSLVSHDCSEPLVFSDGPHIIQREAFFLRFLGTLNFQTCGDMYIQTEASHAGGAIAGPICQAKATCNTTAGGVSCLQVYSKSWVDVQLSASFLLCLVELKQRSLGYLSC